MKDLIEIKSKSGKSCLINCNNILFIRDYEKGSIIHFGHEKNIVTKETVQELFKLMS